MELLQLYYVQQYFLVKAFILLNLAHLLDDILWYKNIF